MSYAQKKQLSGNPALSIFLTIVVVGSLLYTIITGLAYNVIKHAAENLKTFDVEEQPPPPNQPPPPPPKNVPEVPPPPVAMKPIVQTPVVSAPVVTVPTPPPIHIEAPPAPPPPPPPAKVQSAHAKGDVRALFSGVDYPDEAVREGIQGSLIARLTISPQGRVDDCSVLKSSGSTVLDNFACRILRRARFDPAINSNGQPVSDTYTTPTIRFELTG